MALLAQHQKLRFGTGQDSGYFWNKIMLKGEKTGLKKGMRDPGQFFIAYQDANTGKIIESLKSEPR